MRPIWLIDRALHAATWVPVVRLVILATVVCGAAVLVFQSFVPSARVKRPAEASW